MTTGVTQVDQVWQEGSWRVESALLDSQMPAYSPAPRAGLLEETGNPLFFYVLRDGFLSLNALRWSAMSTSSIGGQGPASLKEQEASTCLTRSPANNCVTNALGGLTVFSLLVLA